MSSIETAAFLDTIRNHTPPITLVKIWRLGDGDLFDIRLSTDSREHDFYYRSCATGDIEVWREMGMIVKELSIDLFEFKVNAQPVETTPEPAALFLRAFWAR
jgi:hypothetical protein